MKVITILRSIDRFIHSQIIQLAQRFMQNMESKDNQPTCPPLRALQPLPTQELDDFILEAVTKMKLEDDVPQLLHLDEESTQLLQEEPIHCLKRTLNDLHQSGQRSLLSKLEKLQKIPIKRRHY